LTILQDFFWGPPLIHPCGCSDAIDPLSGVRRSTGKCNEHLRHRRDPKTLDAAYYARHGLVGPGGEEIPTPHADELREALGPFPARGEGSPYALEIGCGPSPYLPAIREADWCYTGIDVSRWAVRWMQDHYAAAASCIGFDELGQDAACGLILAAHVLEHLPDAPAAVAKCARLLAPGGELWVVVPDDTDPLNPDHDWFFTPATLNSCLGDAGLVVGRMAVRRPAPPEWFIYCLARKPA
jgi:SAM-dependent methyltransferase